MNLVKTSKKEPYIGFVLIPEKNQFWIAIRKTMEKMNQNINKIF